MKLAETIPEQFYKKIKVFCKYKVDNYCVYNLKRYGIDKLIYCTKEDCPILIRS